MKNSMIDVINAEKVFFETAPDDLQKRLSSMEIIQKYVNDVTPSVYESFYLPGCSLDSEKVEEFYRNSPLFHFYDHAFEKVLNGVKTETVAENEVAIWYLYNMGCVIKTSKHCFGIDIHHRRSEELVPYLEFVMVTHNHRDHSTLKLLQAMLKEKKMIYSNFFPSLGGYSKEPFRKLEFDDLTIYAHESDHNPSLQKFVMPFEIVCGKGENACVIFHSGDSHRAEQLKPVSDHVDFHIVHPFVGLKVVDAATQTVKGETTVIAHLLELHHEWNHWRWTYKDGIAALEQVIAAGKNAILPVWGDKILWKEKK